jgi:hypothetical protein
MSKGAQFGGFRGSRVRGVLGGISSIPLDLASFGGPNIGYGVPMRCSYYPQILGGIYSIPLDLASFGGPNPWSDSGDRELDLGELTRGCCSSPSGPA